MFKPDSFDEIFGQDHIIKTLRNMDFGGKAIFLEGEKGTGKTSIAKIIANIFASSQTNIDHINCAYYTDVKNMRAKVDEFNDSSIFGKNKVYIFDEPQRLSGAAMSALFIPSENLRSNVLVILCSMEPEKVEDALSDRFIRLRTKLLDKKTSMDFINFVCERNSIQLDKFRKVLIAEKCDGNPRKIINAIPKVKDIEDVKDIEYLLDLASIEEDEDIVLFFKLLLSMAEWRKISYSLNNLLKIKSPGTIRTGILSLIGNGLLKGFGAGKEKRMIYMYDILKDAYQIPEKATLIAAIGKICIGERKIND